MSVPTISSTRTGRLKKSETDNDTVDRVGLGMHFSMYEYSTSTELRVIYSYCSVLVGDTISRTPAVLRLVTKSSIDDDGADGQDRRGAAGREGVGGKIREGRMAPRPFEFKRTLTVSTCYR